MVQEIRFDAINMTQTLIYRLLFKQTLIFGRYTHMSECFNDVIFWYIFNQLQSFIAQWIAFLIRKKECDCIVFKILIFIGILVQIQFSFEFFIIFFNILCFEQDVHPKDSIIRYFKCQILILRKKLA